MKVLYPQSAAAATIEIDVASRRAAASPSRPFASREERPDIEGLRGFAILTLLAVHVVPSLSAGGASGIDIFFVVSGYLLVRTLMREGAAMGNGVAFLGRRLQGGVPALVAVLIGCLAFASLFTLPKDLQALGRAIAWGAGLLSNFDAWRRDVPIDAALALDPLSHLWQVAALAQGGLLLVLMTSLMRQHPSRLWAMLGLSGFASLAFNLAAVADAPGAAFYLLGGRWWELAAGAALALFKADQHVPSSSRGVRAAIAPHLGWLGIGCFAVAGWLAGDTLHFPGAWALWPVAGTLCLLTAGPASWLNRQVLAQPVLRFYGRVSYPLYLWHWPVLCFPLMLGVPLSADTRVLILIAGVVLAVLTHEMIEKPVVLRTPTRRLSVLLLVALGGCIALGSVVVATDGLRFTFPVELKSISVRDSQPAH